MLSGTLPFVSRTLETTLLRLLRGDATPLATHRADVPPEVVDWMMTMLAPSREQRFASARAALEAGRSL